MWKPNMDFFTQNFIFAENVENNGDNVMTHDKLDLTETVKTSNSTAKQLESVRQDFEAHIIELFGSPPDYDDDFMLARYLGYQAGRAAERAEIREKLESEETVASVSEAICGATIHKFNNDGKHLGKAAITKILEVM